MKKIALVLACALSLGLWVSCDNAQDLNVTLDTAMVDKSYKNGGTVTAKKITMVSVLGEEVSYDIKGEVANKPTGNKWKTTYLQVPVEKNTRLEWRAFWFYNKWNDGEDVEFDVATVEWNDKLYYEGKGTPIANEQVSNVTYYDFSFKLKNDSAHFDEYFTILRNGDAYHYGRNTDSYGTAKLDVSGNLEGNFEIAVLGKKLDSEYDKPNGEQYTYVGEKVAYKLVNGIYVEDEDNYQPAKTNIYYFTDVAFKKN